MKLSTAYHWETDGQTEIVNQHIANCLHPFVNQYQGNWSDLLPMMDFAAAVLHSETTEASSFLIDCGYEPHTSFDWTPRGEHPPPATQEQHQQAQETAHKMEEIWRVIHDNILHAQDCQKTQADKH